MPGPPSLCAPAWGLWVGSAEAEAGCSLTRLMILRCRPLGCLPSPGAAGPPEAGTARGSERALACRVTGPCPAFPGGGQLGQWGPLLHPGLPGVALRLRAHLADSIPPPLPQARTALGVCLAPCTRPHSQIPEGAGQTLDLHVGVLAQHSQPPRDVLQLWVAREEVFGAMVPGTQGAVARKICTRRWVCCAS